MFKLFKRNYSTGYCKFDNGVVVTDEQIAKFVRQHTHWWDRLDYHMVCDCAQIAFDILAGHTEAPKSKHWYFTYETKKSKKF